MYIGVDERATVSRETVPQGSRAGVDGLAEGRQKEPALQSRASKILESRQRSVRYLFLPLINMSNWSYIEEGNTVFLFQLIFRRFTHKLT